jgi:hypothetical protein
MSWSILGAIVLSLGTLMALQQVLHTPRLRSDAHARLTPPAGAWYGLNNPATPPPGSAAAGASLPAPRPALAVRVLTLDLTDPWNPLPLDLQPPTWTTRSGDHERDVVPVGAYVYAVRGYGQVDILDPADSWPGKQVDRDFTAAIIDHYAYFTAGAAGVRILDFTAPSSEQRERRLATPGRAEAVIISGDHAHVAVVQHVPAYAGYD